MSVVRNVLKLTSTDLSTQRIKALWIALDADSGGQISSNEFGRFMRLAQRAQSATSPKRQLPDASTLGRGRAAPLPDRLRPGANKPQGVFKKAMETGLGNPGAPPRGPSYEDSPWLPKNRKLWSPQRQHSPSRPRSPPSILSPRGLLSTSAQFSMNSSIGPNSRSPSPPHRGTSAQYSQSSRGRMVHSARRYSPLMSPSFQAADGNFRWPAP